MGKFDEKEYEYERKKARDQKKIGICCGLIPLTLNRKISSLGVVKCLQIRLVCSIVCICVYDVRRTYSSRLVVVARGNSSSRVFHQSFDSLSYSLLFRNSNDKLAMISSQYVFISLN